MTLVFSLDIILTKIMSTPGTAREEGFLKLVYPKGRVELHRHPITAAEVLKRNPRCCVARPDVFKYPWIVVRPESVLSIGRVFYVVPRHTIHRLLKQRGIYSPMEAQMSQQEQLPPKPNAKSTLIRNVEIAPRRKTYRGEESIGVFVDSDEDHSISINDIQKRACKPLSDRELAHFYNSTRQESNQQGTASQIEPVNLDVQENISVSRRKQRVRRSSNSSQVYDYFEQPPMTDKQKQVGAIEPQKKLYPIEQWPTNPDTKKHHRQQLKPYDSNCGTFPRIIGSFEASCSTTELSKLKSSLKKHMSNGPRSRQLKVSFNKEIKYYHLEERICTS